MILSKIITPTAIIPTPPQLCISIILFLNQVNIYISLSLWVALPLLVVYYLYLGDFLLVPSALGIRPLAFALAVSVEPSFVPDFIFFFKTARDGAFSSELSLLLIYLFSCSCLVFLSLFPSNSFFDFCFLVFSFFLSDVSGNFCSDHLTSLSLTTTSHPVVLEVSSQ